MQTLNNLISVIQILSALSMVGLILIQHGKGADMGVSFGSGASGSLFGATGSANFLSRTTAFLATIFLISTLSISYLNDFQPARKNQGSVLEKIEIEQKNKSISNDIPSSSIPDKIENNDKIDIPADSSKEIPKSESE